jgi:hypothetical protein
VHKRMVVVMALTVALSGAWAFAQQPEATTTKILTGTISGVTTTATGTCPGTGYSAICPSGTCSCLTMAAGAVTGELAGKGTAVVNISIDTGSATSAVVSSSCYPVFGVADLSTTVGGGRNKTSKSETLNLAGALCDPLNSHSSSTIDGGFGIAATPAPSPAASGWGSFTGSQKDPNSKLTLKFKGSVTQ